MSSFQAYGDFEEMNHKCKTLEELKNYILEHYNEIQEWNELDRYYTNQEAFDELLDIINDNLKKAA
jgi:DNA phosphorothioation-dependent restriction protein DptG